MNVVCKSGDGYTNKRSVRYGNLVVLLWARVQKEQIYEFLEPNMDFKSIAKTVNSGVYVLSLRKIC